VVKKPIYLKFISIDLKEISINIFHRLFFLLSVPKTQT